MGQLGGDLRWRQRGVNRHAHRAEPLQGQIANQPFVPVASQQGYMVAGSDAHAAQGCCCGLNVVRDLTPGAPLVPAAAIDEQGRAVGVFQQSLMQGGEDCGGGLRGQIGHGGAMVVVGGVREWRGRKSSREWNASALASRSRCEWMRWPA